MSLLQAAGRPSFIFDALSLFSSTNLAFLPTHNTLQIVLQPQAMAESDSELCDWAASLFSCWCINKIRLLWSFLQMIVCYTFAVGYRCCQTWYNLLDLGLVCRWTGIHPPPQKKTWQHFANKIKKKKWRSFQSDDLRGHRLWSCFIRINKGKKGRTCIWDQSESPALSSVNPPPSKIKMYGPVICWQKKTSIEFYIYSKWTQIKPHKKPP